MDLFSETSFELVEGLTQLDAARRTSLGEESWTSEDVARKSVWDCSWLEGHQRVVDSRLVCRDNHRN